MVFLNKHRFALLAAGAFVLYWVMHFGVLPSGDSIENIRQIEKFDIFSRSSHFTFHLLGVLAYAVFGVLGCTAVISTELMLALVSALSVPAFLGLAEELLEDRRTAWAAAVIYAFSSGIWRFSVQSEYLILVPALGIGAMYFYIKRRPAVSGAFIGLAMLVSPFIVLTAPFFLYNFKNRRAWYRLAAVTAGCSLLVYAGANVMMFQNTVSGNWSLSQSLYRFIKLIDIGRGMAVLLYGLVRSYHIVLPLAVTGGLLLFRKDRRLLWIAATVFVLHVPTTLAEARQGAYMFGSYPLLSLVFAAGIPKVILRKRYVLNVLLAVYIVISGLIVYAEQAHFRDTVATYRQLEEDERIEDGALIFVYPSTKPFNYYIDRLQGTSIESYISSVFAPGMDPAAVLAQHPAAYLVESGIREPDDMIKRFLAGLVKHFNVRGSGFGHRMLKKLYPDKHLVPLAGFSKRVYRLD